MWYIYPTQNWIDDVVKVINNRHLKPENSKFIIAFFSSMDNQFVDYFKNNKEQISSFSGRNVHIFTPLIYDKKVIADDEWRYMRNEFKSFGIPIKAEPTFIFFNLEKMKREIYEPRFFSGFVCNSFRNFPNKLKSAIDACVETDDIYVLSRELSEIFMSENIVLCDDIDHQFKRTIVERLPKMSLFISHSNFDKPFVRKLISELSNDESLKFWLDEKEILVGDDIQKSITSALNKCDILLLIISEHSIKSSWVNFEISQFMSTPQNKKIIPIVISPNQNFPEPINNMIKRLKYLDFAQENNWSINIEELKHVIGRSY
jgi:hypothetical protein